MTNFRVLKVVAAVIVIAFAAAYEYAEVEDILKKAEEKGEAPFIILLDGIEDPHNLGAILRSVDAFGADGVIIGANRQVRLNSTVAKVSTGAIEYVDVCMVTNLNQAVKELKEAGLNTVYLQFDGVTEEPYLIARSKNLLDVKLDAIKKCREAGLGVVIVPTVVKGVNDQQVGDIIRFAIENIDVICPNCGEKLKITDSFCLKCGAHIVELIKPILKNQNSSENVEMTVEEVCGADIMHFEE